MVALYVLAGVGAAVVVEWLLRPLRASLKVRRAANEFHAASIEALAAIGLVGPTLAPSDLTVRLALRRWVSARAAIRSLSEDEQQLVAEILGRRHIAVAEAVQAITAFMEACGRENGSTAGRAVLAPLWRAELDASAVRCRRSPGGGQPAVTPFSAPDRRSHDRIATAARSQQRLRLLP